MSDPTTTSEDQATGGANADRNDSVHDENIEEEIDFSKRKKKRRPKAAMMTEADKEAMVVGDEGGIESGGKSGGTDTADTTAASSAAIKASAAADAGDAADAPTTANIDMEDEAMF